MKPTRKSSDRLKVFLDSSMIVAGICSESGASGAVLDLCEAGLVEPVISQQVVIEVDRTISAKLPLLAERLRAFIIRMGASMVEDPPIEAVRRAREKIHEKDAPIFAAAKQAGVDYLLTLDKKHFLNPRRKIKLDPPVLTPGEFLGKFEEWAMLHLS